MNTHKLYARHVPTMFRVVSASRLYHAQIVRELPHSQSKPYTSRLLGLAVAKEAAEHAPTRLLAKLALHLGALESPWGLTKTRVYRGHSVKYRLCLAFLLPVEHVAILTTKTGPETLRARTHTYTCDALFAGMSRHTIHTHTRLVTSHTGWQTRQKHREMTAYVYASS